MLEVEMYHRTKQTTLFLSHLNLLGQDLGSLWDLVWSIGIQWEAYELTRLIKKLIDFQQRESITFDQLRLFAEEVAYLRSSLFPHTL